MVGADLFQADLTGANFKNAQLSGADLSGALLNGADLRGADLRGSQLVGANLNGANLSQANLSQANLENALLHGTTLTGSNLADINLTGADLDGLKYDSSTRWPESFSVAAAQSQRTGIDFSGLKIILFTTGSSSKTDAWVAIGVEGLAALSTLGAETTHALVLPNQLTAMRYYAQQHPDIIIGHGSEYSKVMPLLAKEFPEIKFIQIDGKAGNGANLAAYQFRYSEAGYVAGTLAGYMSASGKIGGLGGEPSFSAEVAHTALTEAARWVNPNITQVPLLYTNDWYDLKAAKPVARQLIADNVDVIVAYADGPVLGAADEAGQATSPVYIIGWTKDQQNLAPQLMLTTINQRIDNVLIEAVRSIQAGTMTWGVQVVGFAEGAQELSPFNPLIPQQVRFEVEGVIQAIIDDKITFDDTGKVIANNYHP
jgi:basic membrane lipoprotein Med (substrate-binding protein (PBP1-ABC) superfamily)